MGDKEESELKEKETRFYAAKDGMIISIFTGLSFGLVFVGMEFIYRGLHEYYELSPVYNVILGTIIMLIGLIYLIVKGYGYLDDLRKGGKK